MLSNPRFITAKEAISFNKRSVGGTGENYALLSVAGLQNAIARPINLFEYERVTDVCTLAASTIFGLSKAHAFEPGNKRTAFLSGLFFVEANGFGYYGATDGRELAEQIIKLCENSASEKELDSFLRERFVWRMGRNGYIRNK